MQRSHLIAGRKSIGKAQRLDTISVTAERYMWFRYAMDDDKKVLTNEDVHELIMMYIDRNDEEIAKFESERRKDQPLHKSAEAMKFVKKQNQGEYKSGFKLPDLTDAPTVAYMRTWNGDINALHNVRFAIFREASAASSETTLASGSDAIMADA
ncbi:translation machinery-associated protein 16 [Tieghemiomyces parasiticus]|uniref:Translation machinery-associated protein 16 n=1 Tax=Tieghemiomyces parasiticus TaxID=78921 RepID=A0A9W8A1W7_9FUNG|nr:translation machinery-associated protein 16 [Tieghemiomyces parasiticus]